MALLHKLSWQGESLVLAAGLLVLLLLLTVGAILLAPSLNALTLFSLPAGFFILSIGTPLLLTGVAFWYLFHQAAIDRKHHRIED